MVMMMMIIIIILHVVLFSCIEFEKLNGKCVVDRGCMSKCKLNNKKKSSVFVIAVITIAHSLSRFRLLLGFSNLVVDAFVM